MRRFMTLATALLALSLCVPMSFAAGKTLKVGYFRLEPHLIPKEGSEPTGAAIEYLKKHIAPEMGVDIEYVGPLALPRLLASLEDGSIDAAVLLAKNPERIAKFAFPSQHFNEMVSAYVVLNESSLKSVTAPKDLYGITVGVGDGVFVHPSLRDDKIKTDKAVGADFLMTNLKKLEAKRVDAVYNGDRDSSVYQVKLMNLTGKVRVIEVPNTKVGMFTAFSKKNADLVPRYEAALKKVMVKTTYNTLLAPYHK